MKRRALLVSFIFIAICLSCSRSRKEPATSAAAEDFNGKWIGTWSWDRSKSASLEISEGQIKVSGLPVIKRPAQETVVVSSDGRTVFDNAYGAKATPCLLLYLPSPANVVPL